MRDTTGASTVQDCTITGNAAAGGGGLSSENNLLVLQRSTVSGNTATTGDGGGVFQDGSYLTMTDSTISGNRAAAKGGGLILYSNAFLSTIRNCTISGNRANQGGGFYAANTSANVLNTTIAFNRAASVGGGVSSDTCTIDFASSIVALNAAAGGDPELEGVTVYSAAFSLFGVALAALPSFTDNGNNLFSADPLLAPLANNGGPTQTHPLKKGSPCINTGSNPTALTTDQRGAPFKRKVGPAADIGAFERQ